jgi:hypothetical protein
LGRSGTESSITEGTKSRGSSAGRTASSYPNCYLWETLITYLTDSALIDIGANAHRLNVLRLSTPSDNETYVRLGCVFSIALASFTEYQSYASFSSILALVNHSLYLPAATVWALLLLHFLGKKKKKKKKSKAIPPNRPWRPIGL